MYNSRWYPLSIRSLHSQVTFEEDKVKPHFELFKLDNIQLSEERALEEIGVNLAGTSVPISKLVKFWELGTLGDEVYDPEVLDAAHRFHWLLELLAKDISKHQAKDLIYVIERWLDLNESQISGQAWAPYTLSERICNWISIWNISNERLDFGSKLSSRLFAALKKHLEILANKLEYPASGIVNNHILNNARALYIGGSFVGCESIVELGRSIFKLHLPKMIGAGGYLLEASSHYHWLLTKNISEVCHVARNANDKNFYQWINDYKDKMQSAGQRLVPEGLVSLSSLPRIGDVSPDIPIDWYDPKFESKSSGWQKIWGETTSASESDNCCDDGWLVAKNKEWFALVYSHPGNKGYPIGHGHDDFGSACVFFQGHPLLVDMGRLSYSQLDEQEFNGEQYMAHSTVKINGSSLLTAGRGVCSHISAQSRSKAECGLNNHDSEVYWSLSKYGSTSWKRLLQLNEKRELVLSDSFEAEAAEGFIYLDPELEVREGSFGEFTLSSGNITFDLFIEGAAEVNMRSVPFYPSYGVKSTTHQLNWRVISSRDKRREVTVRISCRERKESL
jgi:hypothetical protein